MLIPSAATVLDASGALPRFTFGTVFTEWSLAPIPFVLTVWVAGIYLYAVHVLHRRGDRWPVGRTLDRKSVV